MYKIGIIGYGIVGKAVGNAFFKKEQEVLWYDKYYLNSQNSFFDTYLESDVLFVCVPTNLNDAGNDLDLTQIDEVLSKIDEIVDNDSQSKPIVIKSTMPVGSTEAMRRKYKNFDLYFSPEFLREVSALDDFEKATYHILGCNKAPTKKLLDILHILGAHIYMVSFEVAEMTKMAINAFLATKVTFANEVSEICESLGIPYGDVHRLMVLDQRIFDSHLDVTSQRGFGGKCLPKDLVALINTGFRAKADPWLLKAVDQRNKKTRRSHYASPKADEANGQPLARQEALRPEIRDQSESRPAL